MYIYIITRALWLQVVPGELTIVTGLPNSGKSEWIDALAVNLARREGWRIALCSMENSAKEHGRKLMEKYIGAARVINVTLGYVALHTSRYQRIFTDWAALELPNVGGSKAHCIVSMCCRQAFLQCCLLARLSAHGHAGAGGCAGVD